MQQLVERIGAEHPLDSQSRAIRDYVRNAEAANVGAMHITCSESCERETVESFQHHFAEDLLASQIYATQSPYRTATLGGRYEWGAASLAEHYFIAHGQPEDALLLVIKINSHVALSRNGNDWHYGSGDGITDGPMCAALRRSLNAEQLPALVSLSESLRSEGVDRAAMLNDPAVVHPQYRGLLAAIASARLQARRAVLDIQNTPHNRDTRILVVPAVTINRPDRDTEVIVGVYDADFSSRTPRIHYRGLGDNPSEYVVTSRHNLVTISDSHIGQEREARDHRQMVAEDWKPRGGQFKITEESSPKIFALAERAVAKPTVKQEVLKTFLRLLADVAVVPTAVTLFIDGAAGIHNVYRAYRLSKGSGTRDDAEEIVNDTLARVANLDERQARQLMVKLSQGLGIRLEGMDKVDRAPAVKERTVAKADKRSSKKAAAKSTKTKTVRESKPMPKPVQARSVAAAKSDPVEFTSATAPSMELQLGAGSGLQMSSLPETSLSMSEPTMGAMQTLSETQERKAPAVQTASMRDARASKETAVAIETKAIVDQTQDVTALAAPSIDAATSSIVDTTKDVNELTSASIEVAQERIVDQAKEVRAIDTAAIPSANQPIETPVPAQVQTQQSRSRETPEIRPFGTSRGSAIPSTPLRQPHVVEPTGRQAPTPSSADGIIEAELISIDGDDDAIIIIDDN